MKRYGAMFYDKDFRCGIGFDSVGSKAYEVSDVWKLGVHHFENGGQSILRICYLRTKRSTYYFQVFRTLKRYANCCG